MHWLLHQGCLGVAFAIPQLGKQRNVTANQSGSFRCRKRRGIEDDGDESPNFGIWAKIKFTFGAKYLG